MRVLLRGRRRYVIGGANGKDTLVAAYQEGPLKKAGALVMEEILIPAIFDEFRDDHNDAPVRVLLGEFANVLNDRNDDKAVWRRKKN